MFKKKLCKVCLLWALILCQAVLLAACQAQAEPPGAELESLRRNQADDVAPETHAGVYIRMFKADYPETDVTKIRWQTLPEGEGTYIIEGNDGNQKCIVKYAMSNQMVLGRVERALADTELANGAPVEKALDLALILSLTELYEAARAELVGGEAPQEPFAGIQELKVSWEEAAPSAYVEFHLADHEVRGITLNAVTGTPYHGGGKTLLDSGEAGAESTDSVSADAQSAQPGAEDTASEASATESAGAGQPSAPDSADGQNGASSTATADAGAAMSAAGAIAVPNAQTLILGADGRYLIRDDAGTADEIPPEAWNTPAGLYDQNTTVTAQGDLLYLRSVVPAAIAHVSAGGELAIIDGSDLIVSSAREVGIDAGTIRVGHLNSGVQTSLRVNAAEIGIRFSQNFYGGANAKIWAEANTNAIYYADDGVYYNENMVLNTGAELNLSASGASGIALNIRDLRMTGARLSASAPGGEGGVLLLNSLYLKENSSIEANSERGYAFSCGEAYVMDSELRGVTSGGTAGVHVDRYLNVNYRELETDTIGPVTIYGSAASGFGIVVQYLRDRDMEFPGGNIELTGPATLEGHVGEGIGLSTNTLYSHEGNVDVTGTAEKGIGISVCSLYAIGNNSNIHGTSNGASPSHFQVYGSIPESAGINALYYLTAQGSATIVGEAPTDLEGSYGIHSLLKHEGDYFSGYISAHGYDYEGNPAGALVQIKGSGETGIFAPHLNAHDNAEITATGSKDGLVAYMLHTSASEQGTVASKIYGSGQSGAGVTLRSDSVNMQATMDLNYTELRATGGEYGLFATLDGSAQIQGSRLYAEATGPSAAAGAYLRARGVVNEAPLEMMIADSVCEAKSPNHGWLFHDIELNISAGYTPVTEVGHFRGEGAETGIRMDFSDELASAYAPGGEKTALMAVSALPEGGGPYVITGVSTAAPPDMAGRQPAISVPSARIEADNLLREEYLHPAKGQISSWEPYAVYAPGMNIDDFTQYIWEADGRPLTPQPEGIAAEGDGVFGAAVSAVRTEPLEQTYVQLAGGSHEIELISDINIGQVTFLTDGGAPIPSEQRVPIGQMATWPDGVERTGFTLDGWDDDDTGSRWNFFEDTLQQPHLTLRAIWSPVPFTVIFDGNAPGDSSLSGVPGSLQLFYGDTVPPPGQAPSRSGFRFMRWATDAQGTQNWNFADGRMPAQNLTLYAVWAEEAFTVRFNLNGGRESATIGEIAAKQGQTVTITDYQPGGQSAPYRENHFFLGWTNGNGAAVQNTFAMPGGNVQLTANWQPMPAPGVPDNVVVYRERATRAEVEGMLAFEFTYTDLLGRVQRLVPTHEWDAGILGRGGISEILIRFSTEAGVVTSAHMLDIYVLNMPVITAAEVHTFTFGQAVTARGSEWSPRCQTERPNFATRTIVTRDIAVDFNLNGLNTRSPGAFSPIFTAVYTDYFGTVHNLSRRVEAVVLPEGEAPEEEAPGDESAPPESAEGEVAENGDTLFELRNQGVPSVTLGDIEIPLHSGGLWQVWGLFNLIILVLALLGSARLLWKRFGKKYREKTWKPGARPHNALWLAAILLGPVVLVLFLLTQNTSLLMVFVDNWSPLTAVLFLAQIVLWVVINKKLRRDEQPAPQPPSGDAG